MPYSPPVGLGALWIQSWNVDFCCGIFLQGRGNDERLPNCRAMCLQVMDSHSVVGLLDANTGQVLTNLTHHAQLERTLNPMQP